MKDITYGQIVCDVCNGKVEPNQTRVTVGGNRIHYPGNCSTPTADHLIVKIMLNNVISTLGAKFMRIDIKKIYLNTPMVRYKYLWLHMSDILDDVIQHYQLQ